MIKIEKYRGYKIICLYERPDDKRGFSFGMRKAKLILEHIDKIKEFVNEGGM